MSLVLAYTAPARGELYPLVPVLDELRERGHRIALRTLSSEVETMRRRGLDATAIAPEVEALQMDDRRACTRAGRLRRSVEVACERAPHDARDLLAAIEEVQPDAVIVDLLAWGALSAAEAWGGPWAAYCPFPLPLPSRTGPPVGPGLRPVHGPAGRLRDFLVERIGRAGFDRLVGRPLAQVRSELGLPSLGNATELFARAPLDLYMSAEPFEYPRPDWPESVVMVGPCSWEPEGELPPELAAVEEPLVLVTTSTEFQDDDRLVEVALEALEGEPLHVVATVPSRATGAAADGATILPFAPHSPILARCACAITHGGMGATQKALALGVPVCAVPFGRDQPEVARRVEVAGAGTRLPARRLEPERLRAKVREAIGCRPGAERMARAFAEAGGPEAAADAVEERLLSPWAERRTPPPSTGRSRRR
ncbi:MAG: glycosyltransferase [Solirubrobacterales bacterium]